MSIRFGNEGIWDGDNGRGKVLSDSRAIQERASLDGDSWSWISGTYNYDAADTILLVKNTDASRDFCVDLIECYGDTATVIQIHYASLATVTLAGTALTAVNLRNGEPGTPNASGYRDETGNTQGSIILETYIAANGVKQILPKGQIVLSPSRSVGIDYVTDGAACRVTLWGHFV